MMLIREIFHCKPGKVRPMVEKFHKMSDLNEKMGMGRFKIMTDFSGQNYWTLVCEFEVANLSAFEEMMTGKGMTEEIGKEFEKIMEGYHDLVEKGFREIYKIEEPKA